MDSFELIISYPNPAPLQHLLGVMHVASFWQRKAVILEACLQSERVCV